MKKPVAVLLVTMLFAACASHMDSPSSTKLSYPSTPKRNHVDDYHGVKVDDPYHWLEDDNSPETKAWVEAQNKVTFDYLERIPERTRIKARLTKLWNYERYGIPFKEGGRYFISRNDGLQNQSVLYTMESLEGELKLLLDPNKLSADGTMALSSYDVSDDGKLMAYGIARSGSDWQEFRVREIATGQDRPDLLKWIRWYGVSWKKDGSGFFYSRFDEPKPGEELKGAVFFQKLYFHRLGQAQSEDKLIYHRPDQKEWTFIGHVTDDGRYLAITVNHGTDTRNRFFYLDLAQSNGQVIELLNDFDASYEFIDNDGPVFFFVTDLHAPRGRVLAIDTTKPQRRDWKEIIPQALEKLQNVSVVNNQFIANYLKDARSQVKLFDLTGKFVREVELPGIGSAGGFDGKRNDIETFYFFTSFTTPGTVYRYDLKTGTSGVFRTPKMDFNPGDYETKQVFYTSKDGTRVPMFITCRKGLKLDGQNPTVLYGYGGFNISLTPTFSVSVLAWLEMGGVYAVPNLRGGGEYGKEWHEAGTKLKKQNVFDDFIAAAEWLIAHKYTSREKLAISGGSNGGLLVGACMIQRADLFRAALPAVGVMDMLRFHKFTGGWAWTSDYGSPDQPEEFKALRAYSPYQNLIPGVKYPATLVTTGDHDDRVVPAHSFKFAARLQEYHRGDNPVLIRIETKAGHGAGKPTSKLIEEAADRWTFLWHELDMKSKELELPRLGASARAGPSLNGLTPTNYTTNWISLFDGKSLIGWKETDFAGRGQVRVEDGKLILETGLMTGVTCTSDLPRMNYEISLEAMRVEGSDFFCGLTFPVGKEPCSFIVGGWGGGVVGLSSLDGEDAAHNDTTQYMNFQNGRWFQIRVQVTEFSIKAWIDADKVVDVTTTGRTISIRPEVEPSKPLGIATWSTTAAIRHIKLRQL
jgi:prolyl oligopeptidase